MTQRMRVRVCCRPSTTLPHPVPPQRCRMTPWSRSKLAVLAALCAAAPALAQTPEPAAKPFKVGVVTFLSGAAAGPFGVPARNAAELLAESLNAGKLPAPYAK